jgi:hypothetical protein
MGGCDFLNENVRKDEYIVKKAATLTAQTQHSDGAIGTYFRSDIDKPFETSTFSEGRWKPRRMEQKLSTNNSKPRR